MIDPFTKLMLTGVLLCPAVMVITYFLVGRRRPTKQDELLADTPAARRERDRLRDLNAEKNLPSKHSSPVDLDEPFRRAAENVRLHPPKEAAWHPRPGVRATGKSPALAAPYRPIKQKQFALTPRQLQRVNIQRRMRGAPPLNRAGFQNAIAHVWDRPQRQPDTSSDWLTYLILYQCLTSDHQTNSVNVNYGLVVNPNEPYNGHGGEFAGAGASGDWTSADPGVAAAAAGIAASAALYDGPYVGEGPGAAVAPDSAPDSSSSYDSGSSSSYDSGSSSSYDSGSSSSSDSGSSSSSSD